MSQAKHIVVIQVKYIVVTHRSVTDETYSKITCETHPKTFATSGMRSSRAKHVKHAAFYRMSTGKGLANEAFIEGMHGKYTNYSGGV